MKLFVIAAAAVGLLVGCSPDSTDFREDAEKFINDSADLVGEVGVTDLADAECVEPASSAVDATFECTAVADDGSRWLFTAVITGERAYTIVAAERTADPEGQPVDSGPAAPASSGLDSNE